LEHGVVGLNIDGARIETADNLNGGAYAGSGARGSLSGDLRTGAAAGMFQAGSTAPGGYKQPKGRWPANVVLGDSPEVIEALGQQSGTSKSTGGKGDSSGKTGQRTYGDYAGDQVGSNAGGLGDVGTAARFFKQVSEE